MAVVAILTGADNLMLRKKTKIVRSFDKDLKRILKDLEDTVHHAEGAGLAAPQIGVSQMVCIARIGKDFIPLINPAILWKSQSMEHGEEGCLSLPDVWLSVPRAREIIIRFNTESGAQEERKLSGWDARVVQHEIDHLHGILIVDYHASELRHEVVQMNALEVVIGLEVHAQMNTKTKLFCACDNDAFGKPPNTTVCPICMGHPGALPVLNTSALSKARITSQALRCEISSHHHLDRKNYFYPDLPSGYQISQYDFPLAKNGRVEYGDGKACAITRLHIENDAGKLTHIGGRSYCDYNRAGTPLMEIVTEPVLACAADAVEFAKELQRILIAADASEADMYKGMMRFDASISLRPQGDTNLYPRSEIKNLNSFKSLEKALLFEEKRLRELWEAGTPQIQEVTVHWDDDKEVGIIMRKKESAADYRYFPEPDIPPLTESEIDQSASVASVELPSERKKRYLANGLPEDQATLLIDSPKVAMIFDAVLAHTGDIKRTSSIVISQLIGFLNSANKSLDEGPSATDIIALLEYIKNGTIHTNASKEVLEEMVKTGKCADSIIKERGISAVTDEKELLKIIEDAIKKSPQAFTDLKQGKMKAKGAIIGFVMGKTKGQADPTIVDQILTRLVIGE